MSLSGLERLAAWQDGTVPLPEMFALLGLRLRAIEKGHVEVCVRPQRHFQNMNQTMHGGWVSSLLDEGAGMALLTTLDPNQSYATLNLNVSFLRAATMQDAELLIQGSIVKRGGRVATSEARLLRMDGTLCATAVATSLIVSAATDS